MSDFEEELVEEIESFDAIDDVVTDLTSEMDFAVAAWHEDGRWTLGTLPDPYDIAQIITRFEPNGKKSKRIFNSIADKELVFSSLMNLNSIIVLLLFGLLTGIIAGTYPAFYLSSFSPIHVLRGIRRKGVRGGRARKILVISQFSISIALIIITMVQGCYPLQQVGVSIPMARVPIQLP